MSRREMAVTGGAQKYFLTGQSVKEGVRKVAVGWVTGKWSSYEWRWMLRFWHVHRLFHWGGSLTVSEVQPISWWGAWWRARRHGAGYISVRRQQEVDCDPE